MKWPNLLRARRQDPRGPSRTVAALCSGVLALLIPVLVLILGLIVQLLVERESVLVQVPSDWALGPWTQGEDWPWFGRSDYCLLALLGAGLIVSLFIAITLLLFEGAVHWSALSVAAQLKHEIHAQSVRLGAGDLLDNRGSRPETLFTEQVDRVRQGLIAWWRSVPRNLVALAALVVLAMAVDLLLAVLAILIAVMIWRIYVSLRRRSEAASSAWQDRTDRYDTLLLEGLQLAPLITTLIRSRTATGAFAESLRSYRSAAIRRTTAKAVVGPVLLFIVLCSAACMLLVIGLGLVERPFVARASRLPIAAESPVPEASQMMLDSALSPRMTVARSIVLGTALICAYFPLVHLYRLPGLLRPAEQSAGEIFAYLDREPRVLQLSGARVMERLQSGIELDRVTVADYGGNRLVDEISLAVPAGRKIGMLASDPRTALALAGLFVRFYDPVFGRVLFDSRDIRYVTLESLREQAALVRCRNVLFTGEVAENINCGDSRFSMLQVTDVAKRVGAYDFIQQLPHGFSTIIGEHGQRLAPGQAFRIALARAMLRDPSLLVIEELFEDDSDSTSNIDQTLAEIATDRTLIFLPSRLSTLRLLDYIYVFHEGKLHAEGSHMALVQSSDLYRHLNYLQFNPFRNRAN